MTLIHVKALIQTSDETRLQYIHDAVNSAFSTFGKRKSPKGAMNRGGRRSPDGSPGPVEEGAKGQTRQAKTKADGEVAGLPSNSDAYQVEDLVKFTLILSHTISDF